MDSIARAVVRPPWVAMALGLCLFAAEGRLARGQDGEIPKGSKVHHGHRRLGMGTLGYGPPGLHPGYPGFGLSYHRGYGYGGIGLGVGANGGSPGYEGAGYPCPAAPTRFPAVGPLISGRPIAYSGIGPDPGTAYEVGFGPFTGALPDPARFAPYATPPAPPAAAVPPPLPPRP